MHSGLPPTTLLSEIKSDTFSALKSDVARDSLDVVAMEPPEIDVETEDDFELCLAVKERGRPTGKYAVLDTSTTIKDHGLAGWDTLYVQFRDRATGKHAVLWLSFSGTLSDYTLHTFYVENPLPLLFNV